MSQPADPANQSVVDESLDDVTVEPPRRPGFAPMAIAMGLWVLAAITISASVAIGMPGVRAVMYGLTFLLAGGGVLMAFVGGAQYVLARTLQGIDQQIQDAAARQCELLEMINERSALADDTRAAAYWQSNAVAMQRAARDLMGVGRFEKARSLIERIEKDFGDRATADRLREQLANSRKIHRASVVEQAQSEVDTHLSQNDWQGAREAARRLAEENADVEKIAGLPDYVEQKHDKYRRRLVMDYKRAASKGDIDTALDTYDELERHSTEEQLEVYREGINRVRNRKKKILTEKFKQAVAQQDWGKAIELGQEIIDRFPDSRTADEVRAIRGKLRKRAETSQATNPEDSVATQTES